MPLEPIEEKDLDLEKKFFGTSEKETTEYLKKEAGEMPVAEKKEAMARVEGTAEKSEAEKSSAYSQILSKVKDDQSDDTEVVASDAQKVDVEQTAEAKVEKLVAIAIEKGVPYAVKVARQVEDYYSLDEFHDKLLTDELHSALIKKGLIKEI